MRAVLLVCKLGVPATLATCPSRISRAFLLLVELALVAVLLVVTVVLVCASALLVALVLAACPKRVW